MNAKGDLLQRRYYEDTAPLYDEMHVRLDDEHYRALRYISGLLPTMSVSSLLDVGCGTGRGVKFFSENHPNLQVKGIEPIFALIEQAHSKNGVLVDAIIQGQGQNLPFPDASFDAVCEFGVLHHIRDTEPVVREMMRVARTAIFLSDENRFAQGHWMAKLAKFALWKSGAFQYAYFLKTRGRGYRYSEGDGVAYSFSVYDALDLLADWADSLFLLPLDLRTTHSWFHPLFDSFHVLLCAIKET